MKKDDLIKTPYGEGILRLFRETDGIYVVELPFGVCFLPGTSVSPSKKQQRAMELNVAYEALEQMRKHNLEVLCQERGLHTDDIDVNQCTCCLLSSTPSTPGKRFVHIQRLVGDRPRISKIVHRKKPASSCLICASPVCREHSSAQFRKEKITLCLECETLFTLNFVVDCMSAPTIQDRQAMMDHMLEIYDRALLLLNYSMQFIPQVVTQLQETTVTQNKVGLGSSSAGIVSGVLGVAAAATILTPAGPPLLIASLLFGGSATAVQTGTEVHQNFFSQPNRLADRIIALHGMALSILRVTSTLRDALLRDYLREDQELLHHPTDDEAQKKHADHVMAGLTAGRCGAAGLEMTALTAVEVVGVGRNAGFLSKTGAGLLRTARFARFAGGALSAATLLLETKCMTSTLQEIRAGNPCSKAQTLEEIHSSLKDLPSTSQLDAECQRYLDTLAQRERRMTEEEVVKLLLCASQLPTEPIIQVKDDDETTTSVHTEMSSSSSSLLERIESFKRRESSSSEDNNENRPSNSSSLIQRITMHKKKRDAVDIPPTM